MNNSKFFNFKLMDNPYHQLIKHPLHILQHQKEYYLTNRRMATTPAKFSVCILGNP